MDKSAIDLYSYINKNKCVTPDKKKRMIAELDSIENHSIPNQIKNDLIPVTEVNLYDHNDFVAFQTIEPAKRSYSAYANSLDELLERDKQREKDGFPRKINIGRLIKPGKDNKGKVVVVPTTVEEKFIHDPRILQPDEEEEMGGTGEGEEGEVIGEQPVRAPEGEGDSSGEGQGGSHEMESSAYELGKILTDKFELPNLKDKGKKRSLTKFTYDLTDRNRGYGQLVDKKATLKKIIETNIALGIVSAEKPIDPVDLLVSPHDKIYRILSREKDYESQAIIFFCRDYSGSMAGKVTDLVVSQHVMIYSWLLYQYSKQVETRFILHDTDAKEVPDFYTYYNSKVAGGTQVSSAYQLVNEIVEKEDLAKDYNIYVFHGTDGDDWDSEGDKSIPELKKMLLYSSRVGITVAKHPYSYSSATEVEKYLEKSGLLKEKSDLLRLDSMQDDADESRIIQGIKKLISHDLVLS